MPLQQVSNDMLPNPINEVQGADIASASTVNLSTATGNYINITGTTTITAITLDQGARRTVKFAGALTLTNGASLILPGGANITTAAGDTAEFRGEAGGVVRCVSYNQASGLPLVSAGSMTSLGIITFSGTGNQFSLGSLTLTNYKQLYITHNATIGASSTPSISNTTGDQSASNNWSKTGAGNSISAGWVSIDLWNGALIQGFALVSSTAITLPVPLGTSPGAAQVSSGATAIGTATTTIYVYIPGAATKSGTMTIYGVK